MSENSAAAPEAELPAVEVKDLTFSFLPGGAKVLQGISFSLPARSRCILFGHNGAGKSTLLELLAGAKMAPVGCVKLLGSDPFRKSSGAKAALVQGGWRDITSDFPATTRVSALVKVDDEAQGDRLARLIDTLGLKRLMNRFIGSLSDGERRRVFLARSLREPRALVLLDEATADLDLVVRQALLDFLAADAEQLGTAVLHVTHVFDGADAWATHLLEMSDGRLLSSESLGDAGVPGGLFAFAAKRIIEAAPARAAPPAFAMPQAADSAQEAQGCEVEVQDVRFCYPPSSKVVLSIDSLQLPRGCRCLVAGLNGCGKSSLMSLAAGRRMLTRGCVLVDGLRAFHDFSELDGRVAILSSEWKQQVAGLTSGRALTFQQLTNTALQDLVAEGHPMPVLASRMLKLVQMLGIDPAKPIGSLSDGALRRVQIALKLLRPSRMLLVDEVTADLDVVARSALLGFLREESEAGCTVLYCTHIMDGLDGWASHLLHLRPVGLAPRLVGIEEALRPSFATSPDAVDEAGEGGGEPAAAAAAAAGDSTMGGNAEVEAVSLFQAMRQVLLEDARAQDEALEAAGADRPQDEAPPDRDEVELPYGWKNRTSTCPGAYGSYAWNNEKGPEEDWSYASIAPTPPQRPEPPPQPTAAGGMPGAAGFPAPGGYGGGGAGPCVAGAPALLGASGGYSPCAAGGCAAPMPGLPALAGGSQPLGAAAGGGAAPVAQPQASDAGAVASRGLAQAADDPCPPGFGMRMNQVALDELIASGKVQPERDPAAAASGASWR